MHKRILGFIVMQTHRARNGLFGVHGVVGTLDQVEILIWWRYLTVPGTLRYVLLRWT